MVNKSDAMEIISWAINHDITIWLDGGWGVDALLGEQTREHNDIDIFVERNHAKQFLDVIIDHGFQEVVTSYTNLDHTVWKDGKERIIDLHVFDFDEKDDLVFLGDTYPQEVFDGIGKIGDIEVRCIGPAYQVQFHLGYEHDENDVRDVRLLCERFGIKLPEEYQ